jgi:hypothetical protein
LNEIEGMVLETETTKETFQLLYFYISIMHEQYRVFNVLPANDVVLKNDVFLILLYATRIPPHLLVAINGKIFALGVKCAIVDGELHTLLTHIRRKCIETLFIKLSLPPLFTMEKLKEEIRTCMLAYPRVDIGIATCLTPIKNFCTTIYQIETKNVNLIFDLLPKLEERHVLSGCYHLNLDKYLFKNSFALNKYQVNDVYEAIRSSSIVMT